MMGLEKSSVLAYHTSTLGSIPSTAKQNKKLQAGHRWLTPVTLATQEAKIRRMAV
jgi:hypothetical protein